MSIDELDDWRAAHECVLQLGPVSADEIVRATALPKKEVVPLLARLQELGLIHKIEDRWRAVWPAGSRVAGGGGWISSKSEANSIIKNMVRKTMRRPSLTVRGFLAFSSACVWR